MTNSSRIELKFDYEIMLSRSSPQNIPSFSDNYSIPVYYNSFKDKFYLNISGEDSDYFKEIQPGFKNMIIRSDVGPEFLEYATPDDEKIDKFRARDLLKIKGVYADNFTLKLGKKEYWRFLFFRENLEEVSKFLLDASEERKFLIEYMGKPRSVLEYIRSLHYGRRVSSVKLLEIMSEEYLKNAPHQKYPFHFIYKSPDFGEGYVIVIRRSVSKVGSGGLIIDQSLIREEDTIITEEKRKSVLSSAYFDSESKFFLPMLSGECINDGERSYTILTLDSRYIPRLIQKLKEINEKNKGYIKFIIHEINEIYFPSSEF